MKPQLAFVKEESGCNRISTQAWLELSRRKNNSERHSLKLQSNSRFQVSRESVPGP